METVSIKPTLAPILTPHGVLMLETLPLQEAMRAARELRPDLKQPNELREFASVIQLRWTLRRQTLENTLDEMITLLNEKYPPANG
jgi:hypothetical protein